MEFIRPPDTDKATAEELFQQLMERAQTTPNTPFEYIVSWGHLQAARYYYTALLKILDLFDKTFRNLCKKHGDFLNQRVINTELAFYELQLQECYSYYLREKAVVSDMILEYLAYIFSGHFWASFFGEERESQNCYDHRKKPRH
jgi:hypothetical protein